MTIKTNGDFLVLPTGVLKSVIVGASADATTRRRVEQLVRDQAKDVLVRQAAIAPDRYEIVIGPAPA